MPQPHADTLGEAAYSYSCTEIPHAMAATASVSTTARIVVHAVVQAEAHQHLPSMAPHPHCPGSPPSPSIPSPCTRSMYACEAQASGTRTTENAILNGSTAYCKSAGLLCGILCMPHFALMQPLRCIVPSVRRMCMLHVHAACACRPCTWASCRRPRCKHYACPEQRLCPGPS